MSRYLVENWTEVNDVKVEKPDLEIMDDVELFDLLQKEGEPVEDALNKPRKKIAVYKLPDTCIIDWKCKR